MKKLLALSFWLLVLQACGSKHHNVEVIIAEPLEIQLMERQDHSELVRQMPQKQFVICSDCPQGMPLSREMSKVNVVVRMSTPSSATRLVSIPPVAPVKTDIKSFEQATSEQNERSSPDPSGPSGNETSSTVCSPPIHFAFNQAVITSEELTRIKSVEELLKESSNIEVMGYTCDIGTKEYNNELAMRRANAVADVLKQMGIMPSKISAEGKCCYVSDDRKKNRRVEITCIQNP